MTRRQFLLSTGSVGTFFCLSDSYWTLRLPFSRDSEVIFVETRRCLFELFTDLDAARFLGKRYLDLYPQETRQALLLAAHIETAQIRTSKRLRKLLALRRERDFRNGEMVIVDGWLLARTEVEACALTALL